MSTKIENVVYRASCATLFWQICSRSGGRRRSDSPAPTSLFVADSKGIIDNYLSALEVESESHLVNPG